MLSTRLHVVIALSINTANIVRIVEQEILLGHFEIDAFFF